jgi:acetyl esterase/lipase
VYRLCLLAIPLLYTPTCLAADITAGAPPAPPGYENYQDARAALQSGAVARAEAKPTVPDSVVFHDDLVYARPGGVALSLDLYVPKDRSTPPPLLLFIHGGAWRAGKKEHTEPYTVPLAAAGYATASIQYRLAPEHTFPKAIQDVNAAIHWLRSHGDQYGFDGGRMALLGGSAGGHLALLAAYAQDPALGAPGHPEGVKQRVAAVVNIYGVTDCTTAVAQAEKRVHDFMGVPYAEGVDQYALASPIFHLDADDPPTLTLHGTIDELVPIAQADRLHKKLDSLGVPNFYDRIEGWPHAMDVAKPVYDRCLYLTKAFLEIYLPLEK